MNVFSNWKNGDILTKAKYVSITGFFTTTATLIFAFFFYWFFVPICVVQLVAYVLVFGGVKKLEAKPLFIAKIILAITIPISAIVAVLYLFTSKDSSFGYVIFTLFFIIFIGTGSTIFAVFVIHRAHHCLVEDEKICNLSRSNPPPSADGVNPSTDPGRY